MALHFFWRNYTTQFIYLFNREFRNTCRGFTGVIFTFIVVNSQIIPMEKFGVICKSRLSTKILPCLKIKRNDTTFSHQTSCKQKNRQILAVGNCEKYGKCHLKKKIVLGLVTMETT